MRGEPENWEDEVGALPGDALLLGLFFWPPEAARFGFAFAFDFLK